jgi:S-methylmethionine-dependent homocysteine/selenocysteine methylase
VRSSATVPLRPSVDAGRPGVGTSQYGIRDFASVATSDGRAAKSVRGRSDLSDYLAEIRAAGRTVVLDGAMGTELEAGGVPMDSNAWCGLANLMHLDQVRRIHEDNIRAGADVVTTNTFMSGAGPMRRAGVADRFEEGIRSAVGAAQQAVQQTARRPVTIAGCLSCRPWGASGTAADARQLRDDYARQIDLLAASGVDVIALEMVTDPALADPALEAALETGLPVWLGLGMRTATDSYTTLPTIERAREVAEMLICDQLYAVNIMHTDIDDVSDGLAMVSSLWAGQIGVYPHHRQWSAPNWTYLDLEPGLFAQHARAWMGQGVGMLGGCCGLTARHVAVLRATVDSREDARDRAATK